MEKKPPCPFTPEELEDSESGMLARYRKRLRSRDPKTMAAVAQGKALATARIVPAEVWVTDPAVVGKAAEGPRVNDSTATPPAPTVPDSPDRSGE